MEIYSYDWSAVSSAFEGFLVEKAIEIKPLKTRKDLEARQLMWRFCEANKASLTKDILSQRDFIIDCLKKGFPAEEAFQLAIDNLSKS